MSTTAAADPCASGGSLYDVSELLISDLTGYEPSLALAATALSLFGLGAIVLGFMTERRRAYRFMHTMTVTGACEVAGYSAMVYAILQSGKADVFIAYVVQQVFVIMSPNIIQATLYWAVGWVLRFSPELTHGRRWLRGWAITAFFSASDVLGITVQTVGISIWASSKGSGCPDQGQIRLGSIITLVGLTIQMLFFFAFMVLTVWSHRHPKNGLVGSRQTRRLYVGLYGVIALVNVRNIFRFVEFTQNTILSWPVPEGTYVIEEQQALFYALDTLPILLCFAVFAWAHPSWLLPPPAELPQQAARKGGSDSSQASSGGCGGQVEQQAGGGGSAPGAPGQQQQLEQFQSMALDV